MSVHAEVIYIVRDLDSLTSGILLSKTSMFPSNVALTQAATLDYRYT